MCVLGVDGSEKKCGPPRIISGTALTLETEGSMDSRKISGNETETGS